MDERMELPIDLTRSTPPHFKWKQVVNSVGGRRVVEHTGRLPPAVEDAVASLVKLAKKQARDIKEIEKINQDLAAALEDSGKSEKPIAAKQIRPKGK